jgi:hypothetical protein
MNPFDCANLAMNTPKNIDLPFFAYGIFKPGGLGFLRIKKWVAQCSDETVPGKLLVRDGLPIAFQGGDRRIPGSLIQFQPGIENEAYKSIVELEPEYQYKWATVEVASKFGGPIVDANYLIGKSEKGCDEPLKPWMGRNDPLFNEALEVVEEVLSKMDKKQFSEFDLKPLFRLEMAYLLLWTSIERYASMRYNLSGGATQKVNQVANESAFETALLKHVDGLKESRKLRRADKPEDGCVLNRKKPKKAMEYYYQVRNNLVHRGKGAYDDYKHLSLSLAELLPIFRETLQAAFEESQWSEQTNSDLK